MDDQPAGSDKPAPSENPLATAGAGTAILLGALASGLNKPTWTAMQIIWVALGASLLLLLRVTLSSAFPSLSRHVLILSALAVSLFLLLRWFVAETGLVSVKDQMIELQLVHPAPESGSQLVHRALESGSHID